MPDNIGYTPGSGASVAADDIGGALYQRMKLVEGADGVNDGDISAANPLPVEDLQLLALIQRLLNIQRSPVGYDPTLNRLRVEAAFAAGVSTAVTGTLTAVTTVGTVSTITAGTITTVQNLTNLGSYGATQLVDYDGRSAWALTMRARIT
jgi:hypothetical protein